MSIIVFILWCMFAISDGVRDGFMYHMRNWRVETLINEHIIFTIHRLFPFIMVGIFEWILLLPAMCVFPWLHDGAYYSTRDMLNPGIYPKRWMDQSRNSTAKSTNFFNPVRRTLIGIFGVWFVVHAFYLGFI